MKPGEYIVLSISNNGTGMDFNTRCHCFEPFFNTKDSGKGLGLTEVFGIVRSNGGDLFVRSGSLAIMQSWAKRIARLACWKKRIRKRAEGWPISRYLHGSMLCETTGATLTWCSGWDYRSLEVELPFEASQCGVREAKRRIELSPS